MSSDIREMFGRHEHEIDGAAERLLSGVAVRQRRRRRRLRIGYAATAVAVAAALIGGYAVTGRAHPATPVGHGHATPTPTPTPSTKTIFSRGLRITVPSNWVLNDIGCRSDSRPTVITTGGSADLCYTPQAPDKQYAYFEPATVEPIAVAGSGAGTLVSKPTTLDGVAAVGALGPVTDGMWVGWIRVTSRNVELVVRDRSKAAVKATLDSAHLVDVDDNGCSTSPPPHPVGGHAGQVVDPAPVSIVVCDYGEPIGDRPVPPLLIASAVLRGADALALAKTLNSAVPGHNQALPRSSCTPTQNPPVNAYLLVHERNGGLATIAITIMACSQRGIDNGVSVHRISVQLIQQMSLHLGAGWGYQEPL